MGGGGGAERATRYKALVMVLGMEGASKAECEEALKQLEEAGGVAAMK